LKYDYVFSDNFGALLYCYMSNVVVLGLGVFDPRQSV